MSPLDTALTDPLWREIIRPSQCHDDQVCIAFKLPGSKSTSNHHFRVLREVGLLTQRYAGTATLNALRAGR